MERTIGRRTTPPRKHFAAARRWPLALLCGLLLAGSALAQDASVGRVPAPEASETRKALAPDEPATPEMKNIYNGIVTTDDRGEVELVLPAHFTARNRQFRYQLTVVGQFAQAIVAREIENDRFTIKTNKPRVKVSWQVTGIR